MALKKKNTTKGALAGECPVNAYARVVGRDTAPVNLETKSFVLQISRDEATRNNTTEFDKPKYLELSFRNVWGLTILGTTTINEIITEVYRCLKLIHPEFSNDWEDVV